MLVLQAQVTAMCLVLVYEELISHKV